MKLNILRYSSKFLFKKSDRTLKCLFSLIQECEETCEDDGCDSVMIEVCAEITREARSQPDCATLFRDDCESHWVGEGPTRVGSLTLLLERVSIEDPHL